MSAIRRRPIALAICLAGLFAVTGVAAVPRTVVPAGDWPQWRGPNRDSISTETGLLDKWPDDGPPLVWTAKDLGAGLSSVSLQGDHIYTMGDRKDDQCVICLNRADGAEIWATPIGKTWKAHNDDPGPRCIPAADGKFVYALGTDGDLVCLESANGKVRWALNFKKDFDGHMPTWAFSESPLVDGDRLLCTPGGKEATMVALNKFTGKVIWKCVAPDLGGRGKDGAGGYSSIVVSEGAGVKQYVQLTAHGLIGVAAKDGKFLWGYSKVANPTANIPSPIVSGDYVFDSTAYNGGAALLKLSKDGSGVKADEVYFLKHEDLQNHHGGMVLVGEYLYGGHGQNNGAPLCIEFKTGKIMWKEKHGTGKGSAAVLYADGKLYFRYQDGTMVLIEASPDSYKEISKFTIPDVHNPSWPHPVIAGGKLYLREQDNLYCYKLK